MNVTIDALTFQDLSNSEIQQINKMSDLENFFQGDFRISIQRLKK